MAFKGSNGVNFPYKVNEAKDFLREKSALGWLVLVISTSRLKLLRAVHLRPIRVVVSDHTMSLRTMSHLGVGFALRCFQRLSLPDMGTQRYRWRDNWYARDPSIPVLSY